MEKSFDFGRLLKMHNHAQKHKSKPAQFVSVADGVTKRLENNVKLRKNSRLTVFDSIRNICASPARVSPGPSSEFSEAQQKLERRRQQLEKWKVENEKKKKVAASQKKKPFLVGVPHPPLRYIPPPPLPVASSSGCVTRSQTARNTKRDTKTVSQTLTQSFAPKNASFNPPKLRNAPKPYVNLVALKPKRIDKKTAFSFNPVLPKTQEETINKNVRQTRSRVPKQKTVEVKAHSGDISKNTNSKTKAGLKINSKTVKSNANSKMDTRNSRRVSAKVQRQSANTDTDSSQFSVCKTPPHPKTPLTRSARNSLHSESLILESGMPKKLLTPKVPIPKSESSSEERLRSPRSPVEVPMTPEQVVEEAKRISPFVTMSRGKDNARKEMKKKIDEGLLDEDLSECEDVDHFRRQLASEVARITELCDTWDRISEQTVLPDPIQEMVLGALGQARLLVAQKLQQVATLVEQCARPAAGGVAVRPADVRGFWDMVFLQVQNVYMRFKKLDELRSRGWEEEQPRELVKKKTLAKPKPKLTVQSKMKDLIAEARKAKKQQAPPEAERTFDAGFFCVRSPARSPPPAGSPPRPLASTALLKAVLSNEAKKSASRNSASFAMLRASALGKDVECDGIAPLPQTPLSQVNLNATPGRSILKQSTESKKPKKSIKAVLFDQPDCESDTSLDERDQTSKGLVSQNSEQKVLETEVVGNDSSAMDIEKGAHPSQYPLYLDLEPSAQKVLDLEVVESLSSMDIRKEDKENSTRKSLRLVRQDAVEQSNQVVTRSRRKSLVQEPPRRSARLSTVLGDHTNKDPPETTPKRRTRRSVPQQVTTR